MAPRVFGADATVTNYLKEGAAMRCEGDDGGLWPVRREEEGWQEEVIRANLGHVEAAYRRAIQYGYRPPLVSVRFYGDVEAAIAAGGRIEGIIKAVDPGGLDALAGKYSDEDVAGLKAAILSVPAGYFPVLVVHDSERPVRLGDCLKAVQLPDRN
jgi:hypothetical protein